MRPLSDRQKLMLELLIGEGLTHTEAAARLSCTLSTFNTQMERIRSKLGARSTLQAAIFFDRLRGTPT